MQVGVLAVQGAFAEHEHVLSELGVSCIELRNAKDLEKKYDALILPGGESTVQGKLLRDSDMFDTIKSKEKCLRQTAWKLPHRGRSQGYR